MTNGELRDLVLLTAVIGLALLFAFTRRSVHAPALPPAVAPLQRPLEEEVSDIRHRVRGVEQHVPIITDHAARLRSVEREMAEVKGGVSALLQGQERMGRQLEMLIAHHVDGERPK